MACISKTAACLRVTGDDLDPDEITHKLGKEPTGAERKGDIIRGKKTGRERVARSGGWRLVASDREPGDLDGQIREILGALTDDVSVWNQLASRFKIDLFCGLFMESGNEGESLSPESLRLLAARSIQLDLDIYGPVDEG